MSAESENFRELRRLLALKRYEQPPPGYFDRFSQKVIARIEAGEGGGEDSLLGLLFGQGSWLLRLWGSFGTKPILAGAFGVTVCSVLIAGVAYSDRSDTGGISSFADPNHRPTGLVQMGSVPAGLAQPVPVSVTTLPGTGAVLSTERRTSLFDNVRPARPQLIMDVVTPGN